MPTEPSEPTLSEVVSRAAEVVDPGGNDEAVAALVQRFEDRDEPVTTVGDVAQELEEAREALDPGPHEPAVVMAAAVATYLAFRRTELDGDRQDLLRLAARAEFEGEPEPGVADWLAAQGVEV